MALRQQALRRLLAAASMHKPLQSGDAAASQIASLSLLAQRMQGLPTRHNLHTSSALAQAELAMEQAPPEGPKPAVPVTEDEDEGSDLTPKQVVNLLDKHIVGQDDAKRAVANALRNRWRRRRIASPMKEDIVPKNILMIGPTGCGKTEIARRLAKLADAPFVKVEATKFTEVGFHGRDVDQIIRDLVDNAVVMMRAKLRRRLKAEIDRAVEEKVLDALCGEHGEAATKETFRKHYQAGELDDRKVKIDVPPARPSGGLSGLLSEGQLGQMNDLLVKFQSANQGRGRSERKEVTVREARGLLEDAETERLISSDTVTKEAVAAVEQDGIVFIDEIDKIVTSSDLRYGADASSEGVQRDLLPIIEGSIVSTKHGNVATDHILFICSGAFHGCKPSDMLAELQGRLPIRVELKGLTRDDLHRILTEPEHNVIRQQTALLATEGVALRFTDGAVREIARVAEQVNRSVDNIGARRLHTILERLVDEISFNAPELAAEAREAGSELHEVVLDEDDVAKRMGDLLKKQDLSKYVL